MANNSRAMLVLGTLLFFAFTPLLADAKMFSSLEVSGGVLWPQSGLARYSDPGVHVMGRIDFQMPGARALMLWTNLSFTQFAEDTRITELQNDEFIIPVEQTTSQHSFAFHIGPQIGSPTRRGFFRPRAAVGIGWYWFQSDVHWQGTDADEPFASKSLDSQGRLGWRAVIGADFFVSRKVGIAANLLHDEVWNLYQDDGSNFERVTARFPGFSIGVVFPIDVWEDEPDTE